MSRRLLALGLLGALVSTPALAQGCDTRFVFRNASNVTVNEFYFGPSTNRNWGRDRLGDGVLASGRQIAFNPGGSGGNYDFRVVWANGDTAELMRVNICVTSEIVATNRGIQAR